MNKRREILFGVNLLLFIFSTTLLLAHEEPKLAPQVAFTLRKLAEKELLSSLSSVVESQNATNTELQFQIKTLHFPLGAYVANGPYHLSFDFSDPEKLKRSGKALVQFIPEDPETPKSQLYPLIQWTILKKFPVLEAKVEKNTEVKKTLFTWKFLPLETSPQDIVLDPDAFDGEVFKQPLHAGSLVKLSQIEKPIIVKRNQWLKLRMYSAEISLMGKVKALQDGKRNEKIRVVYPDTKKVIEAKLISSELAEVPL